MNGRLLVTGASGFVGGAIARAAVARGIDTVGLVRGAPQEPWQMQLREWDEPGLRAALEGVEVVVHSASVVHRPGAPSDAYARFNVAGMRALIAACRARGVRRVSGARRRRAERDGLPASRARG